jgi:hypothetical protein
VDVHRPSLEETTVRLLADASEGSDA